jgi:REP element-mobilizing transposase RayT
MSRPKAHTLYNARVSEPGRIYLVTSITDNRRPLFADWRAGRLVVEQFISADNEGLAGSLVWVVMPDHFHWLFELKNTSLGEVMSRIKSRSSRAINQYRNQSGRVWQKGYHERTVRREEDLKKIGRYVVANPLRARLVEHVGDYPLWDAIWV